MYCASLPGLTLANAFSVLHLGQRFQSSSSFPDTPVRFVMPATQKKVAVDFRPSERLSDRTMSYGSDQKQGGIDEIHLFGIHRARKIRRDDQGRATSSIRRML